MEGEGLTKFYINTKNIQLTGPQRGRREWVKNAQNCHHGLWMVRGPNGLRVTQPFVQCSIFLVNVVLSQK